MEPRDKTETDGKVSRVSFSKTEIRRRFAELRAGKSASALAELSSRVVDKLLSDSLFSDSSAVALYSPVGGEVDISGVLSDLIRLGKKAFFPKVCGSDLRFFEVAGAQDLSPGAFGIAEPEAEPGREIAVSELDLMVVPGICFDRFGSRVGYGKGFYDRAMRNLSAEKVCAVAYSFQIADFEIPAEPHDRRVGFVITERGVFRAETEKKEKKND